MTSPKTITSYLKEQKTKYCIVPVGTKLKDSANKNTFLVKEAIRHSSIILLLTYQDLKNNLSVINKSRYNGKIFVVFAPVIKFRAIKNATLMDVVSTDIIISQSFKFRPADFSLLHTIVDCKVTIEPEDYLAHLIEKALAGSILTKLMTLLYQIPNSKVQNMYRDLIIGWFVKGDGKIKTVSALISGLPDKKLLEKLLLLIENSNNYKEAFLHIAELKAKNKPILYDKLSEKFEVSNFDIRYMLSVSATIDLSALKT